MGEGWFVVATGKRTTYGSSLDPRSPRARSNRTPEAPNLFFRLDPAPFVRLQLFYELRQRAAWMCGMDALPHPDETLLVCMTVTWGYVFLFLPRPKSPFLPSLPLL